MNDEIKEILDDLKFTNNDTMWCDKITLDVKQSHLLLDYITNLQEEYEKADYDRHKLFEQKEKAIEYINKNKKVVSKYEAKDTRLPLDTFMWGVDNLLNILQNGSESND